MPRFAATALAAALAVLAPGCGDTDDGAAGAGAAIPPDAFVYLEGDISGEGDQHSKLDTLLTELGELPLLGTPVEPKDLITQALEDSAADSGLDFSYAEDVESWLGDSIAVGYSSLDDLDPGFVVSFAVDDEEIARDSLDRIVSADSGEETRAEYDGVSYYRNEEGEYAVGVFDEMLVLTTASEFEAAVDASRGDSVTDDDAVSDAFDALSDERLAALYVDVEAAAESEAETEEEQAVLEQIRGVAPELLEPLAVGVVAGERALALDVAVSDSEGAPDFTGTSKLAEAPSDAFAALGFAALGEQVSAILTRVEPIASSVGDSSAATLPEDFERVFGVPLDEALASIGDSVAHGRGELPDEFVVTLDADIAGESDAPERVLERLERLAGQDDDTVLSPALDGGTGFSAEPTPDVADTSAVRFINAELEGELHLLAASDREAAEQAPPADTLGETERFQAASDALSDDYAMVGFADLEPILDSVVPGGSILDLAIGDVPPEQALASFLADKLGFAAIGVREDGDHNVQRLLVGLR